MYMDTIRRFLRKLLPKSFYSIVSGLTDSTYIVLTEGIVALKVLDDTKTGIKKIDLKTIKHPFFFDPMGAIEMWLFRL